MSEAAGPSGRVRGAGYNRVAMTSSEPASAADPASPAPAHRSNLRARLRRMPNEPGVYRFLGEDGEVLYVGKAKALRKRVASYLRKGGPVATGRVPEMVARARDIEWVVVGSESEALLLEDNFIKEYRPPFNLRLRDDKSYPYIEITMTDEWPRVRFFRGRHVPGNLYFGPFSSAKKVRETLELIGRIFPYRKCKGEKPGRPSGSPCLQYFIKRSLGPCDGCTDREEYMAVIEQVVEFLRGRLVVVERDIERDMAEAAGGAAVREGGAAARPACGRAPHPRAADGAHRGRRVVRRRGTVPGRTRRQRPGVPRAGRRRGRPADVLRRERRRPRGRRGPRGVPARVLLGRQRGPAAGDRAVRGRRTASWRRCWARGAAPPSRCAPRSAAPSAA